MKTFNDLPLAPGEQCQHCGSAKMPDRNAIRESPNTGFWCKKHWEEGPRCVKTGCDEPLMRKRDSGDGFRCRAHIFIDAVTDEEREVALIGRHPLAAYQSQTHWGTYPNAEESKKVTKKMRNMGIPGVNFWDQSILSREGDGK